ncbi:DUF3592 domain-containing protein [Candidatus Uabimicrobium sp. HlEnr_7]|uniref:DUF3592 domain-containing protein n=1 Tax=Candidatus Uabimicrobium helgolandensis TaxID=3095367 RepID=UPI0035578524
MSRFIRAFVFLSVGLGCFWGTYINYVEISVKKEWPSTTGEIVKVRVRNVYRGYVADVDYKYSIKGLTYISKIEHRLSEAESKETPKLYPRSKKVTLYYNPATVEEITVDPTSMEMLYFLLFLAIAFSIAGLKIALTRRSE